jgi:DNA-binding MarR family transcriptional regulator
MRVDDTISTISKIKTLSDNLIVHELEKRGHDNLAPSHGNILAYLIFQGELTKTELARKIKKKGNTVTTLVKKLEDLGYVASRVNAKDARSTIVYLTQKGIEMKDDFIEISNQLYDVQYEGFTPNEIEEFRTLLMKMKKNFENY